MKSKKRNPGIRWLKAGVSLAFFVFLYLWIRKAERQGVTVADTLRQFNGRYFVYSLLIVPVMLFTSCAKWKVLLDLQGHRVPFFHLIRYYLIGYYFSNILPSNVGGDVVRLFYAGRQIGSHAHAGASVFLERFTGLLLLLALVIVTPLLQPGLYGNFTVWVPALGAAGVLVLFLLLMRLRSPVSWVFNHLHRIANLKVTQKLAAKAQSFQDKLSYGAGELLSRPAAMLKVVGLTVVFYLLAAFNVWLAFRTFGFAPAYAPVIAVLPVALSVAMAPIALGSLGIAESSYVWYFALVGLPKPAIIVMALFLRAKLILLGLIGLGVYLTYKGERFRRDVAERDETPGAQGS